MAGLRFFFQRYTEARQELNASLPPYAESELRGQFSKILQISAPQLDQTRREHTADMLYRNYWENYKAGCYVKEEVERALKYLSASCRMGVVSNFRVTGGIEELLEMLDIRKYFSFVVTSVAAGIRKPHHDIYKEAIKLSGAPVDRIVFVGDDYVNDYMTPIALGMKAVYYDKYSRHSEAEPRFADFLELPQILSRYLYAGGVY